MLSSQANLSDKEQCLSQQAEQLREEFGPQIEAQRDYLFDLCRRLLGDREQAKNIVQNTLKTAIARSATYTGRGSIKTWLWNIARNDCLRELRRRQTRVGAAISLDQAVVGRNGEGLFTLGDMVEDTTPSPEAITVEKIYLEQADKTAIKLWRTIFGMAASHQWDIFDYQVFILYTPKLNEPDAPPRTFHEVGCLLGKNENTVKYRWYRRILPAIKQALQAAGIPVPDTK